jgi:hypothetical protein
MPAIGIHRGRLTAILFVSLVLAGLTPVRTEARSAAVPPPQEHADPSVVREIALPVPPRSAPARVRGLHPTAPPVQEVYVFVDSLDGRPLDDDAGWTHIDNSEKPTAWHIDSLFACQGKAWWCGLVDSSWIYDSNRAGYDNSWYHALQNQIAIDSIPLSTPIRISFRHYFNAEPDYDWGQLEVFDPYDAWTPVATFNGEVGGPGASCDSVIAAVPDSVRSHLQELTFPLMFRFLFTSDIAYSSADGLYDGDGWAVDNVTVTAGTSQVLFFDDCENGPGTWQPTVYFGVGDYWRLANNVVTEDLCTNNRTNIWVDFDAITNSLVSRLDNWLITPPVDIQRASEASVTFDVYRNLPLDNCFYYFVRLRTKDVGDADWSAWLDPTRLIYYGAAKDWARQRVGLVGAGGHDSIQVALALKDFGQIYCGGYSSPVNTYAHFDNVAIGIVGGAVPTIQTRAVDLFQDTFQTAPFMYRDDNFNTPLGDSAVVQVEATHGYLNGFMYYRINGGSFASVPLQVSEPALPNSRFADVPAASYPSNTRLEYYFSVTDSQNVTSYYPWDAPNAQTYLSASILPLKGSTNPPFGCTDSLAHVLFVNNFAGREAETTIASALTGMGYKYDTYSVNGPSSGIGNDLGGSQVGSTPQYYWPQTDVTSLAPYSTIIWHAGDLTNFSLSQGDQQVLQSWIQQPGRNRNLWIIGDNIAYQLGYLGGDYNSFLGYTCGTRFIRDLWENLPQDSLHPVITGLSGSPTAGRYFHASADCPGIAAFDLINLSSTATLYGKAAALLRYPNGQPAATRYARRYSGFGGDSSRVVFMGFNYNAIEEGGERLQLMQNVMHDYFGENPCFYASGVEEGSPGGGAPPVRDALQQNAPNPFNPATTIGYSVSRAGRVEIRIFGVGGRLVRRFVEHPGAAGRYAVRWDGRDGSGRSLSSGVYFYEIETEGGYRASRKMLMLK